MVSNLYGKVTTQSVWVGVPEPPLFLENPQSVENAQLGDSLQLKARAVCAGAIHYSWEKDGVHLPVPTAAFSIPCMSSSDEGVYVCIAEGPGQRVTRSTPCVICMMYCRQQKNVQRQYYELPPYFFCEVTCGESPPQATPFAIQKQSLQDQRKSAKDGNSKAKPSSFPAFLEWDSTGKMPCFFAMLGVTKTDTKKNTGGCIGLGDLDNTTTSFVATKQEKAGLCNSAKHSTTSHRLLWTLKPNPMAL